MLKLTRRGKAESPPLKADEANRAVIEARDEALADAVALRDRCDNLYAASRAKDATIAEAEARGAEALELASSAEADATDLRERLAEVLGVRDAAVAAQSERADRAEASLHDIDLILDGVPGLSQDHPGQAGAVAELAERCKAAEAEAARSGEIADGLRGRRAKLVRELADVTVRADRAEAELARVAAALAPLTVTTGMTHAERALAAGVIRDSISLPAPARPEGLTVRACHVDETVADPYQGLGSGGMIP